MNIINSFQRFKTLFFAQDDLSLYDFIDKLSQEEELKLKEEIRNWTDQELLIAYNVLKDCGMSIPEVMLKKVLSKNIDLAFEVFTKGVGDTEERTRLVNACLEEMQLPSWPTYGEGDIVYEQFIQKLKIEAPKFNVVISID